MYHICQFFFMWIITYINKGLNLFSFYLKNFKDFKLNYYVQRGNSKITKYLSNDTSRGFLRYRRSKMFPSGFIGVCSLGVWEAIFGGSGKKLIFFLQITHNGKHINNSKKISKNLFFWWGWVVRVKVIKGKNFIFCDKN